MKRPKLYFQTNEHSEDLDARLRIIYPDGSCEWFNGHKGQKYPNSYRPCWAESQIYFSIDKRTWNKYWLGICKSQKEAIKLMHKYDKNMGFSKAIYLGEL